MTRGGGPTRYLSTIIKFFQGYDGPKAGKNTKAETPNNLFLRPASPVHPPFLLFLFGKPVPFFPTTIVTVGDNEDGEAEGWLYPPPSSFTHMWIPCRARTNASFSQWQRVRPWPLVGARWETRVHDSMQWLFHRVQASRSLRVVRPRHHTQRGSDQDTWKWHCTAKSQKTRKSTRERLSLIAATGSSQFTFYDNNGHTYLEGTR